MTLSLLSQSFAKLFFDTIHKFLKIHKSTYQSHFCLSSLPCQFTPPNFLSFTSVTTDEVSKLLSHSPGTNCDLDPIPTCLLKRGSHILLPTISSIIDLSVSTCIDTDQFYFNCSWH